MLASLRILDDAGGALSRGDFIAKMADFMGTSPIAKNGTENRVPYNKTKFDRYFGFIDVKQNGDLLLTPRGRRLLPYIVRKTTEDSPDKIYELDHECRNFVQELFLDSCCFDSFGSYNCGAETSNSDIEPPRLILRSLEILDQMTKWELGYVLWGLDRGLFDSYSVALDAVVKNRHEPAFNYPEVLGEWDKANFVKDFKMVDLFADENISLIQETDDGNFCLIDSLPQEHKLRISYMNPISQPLQMS